MHKQYAIPINPECGSVPESHAKSELFAQAEFSEDEKAWRSGKSEQQPQPSPRRPRDRSHRGGMVGWPSVSYVLELEKLTHAFQPHPLTQIFHHVSTILFITTLILYWKFMEIPSWWSTIIAVMKKMLKKSHKMMQVYLHINPVCSHSYHE